MNDLDCVLNVMAEHASNRARKTDVGSLATGYRKPLAKTAKEIIAAHMRAIPWNDEFYDAQFDESCAAEADGLLKALREAGYSL